MSSTPAGTLKVDAGAGKKLVSESVSLLAAGILEVTGEFRAGDVVRIIAGDNHEIGRGLSNYSSDEIARIKGINSRHFQQILGYPGDPEVVHRNNLFTSKNKYI